MKATAARARTLVNAHAKGRLLRAGEAAAQVKAGLPIAELDALRALLGLTVENLAGRIGISLETPLTGSLSRMRVSINVYRRCWLRHRGLEASG
jgi:hypothetical protein